jgi:ribosomal protein L13E
MSSQAQIDANRKNAQLSTGPTSEAGKAKSSLNAVKSGLTGRTVLLPGDDAAAYQGHVDRIFAQWQPFDDNERSLTQTLADTEWRLLRIPSLEAGIYALGRLEFKEKFAEEPEAVRASLIEAHTFLTYRKDLNNLSIQEGRLQRMREKTTTALGEMQERRRKRVEAQVKQAAIALQDAKRAGKPFNLAEFGFEISMEQVEASVLGWIESRERHSSSLLAVWEHQFRQEIASRKKAA